ncbi:ABC transporter substrate-binding protein [Candidatus Bipolaricaulota bacterium]|nr:ABC transporter substrate-binding protein [Candidatus Bipolaricaulota bacterium]
MEKSQLNKGGITRRSFLKRATGTVIGLSALNAFNARAQNAVKLGVIWPLGVNPAGLEMKKGADFAQQMVNSQFDLSYPEMIPQWEGIPNLGSPKLELVYADHEFDPELGASLVSDMKAKGVAGIVGSLSSHVTDKVSKAAYDMGLPMVTSSAFISPLTKRGMDSFFRICSDSLQGAKSLFASLSNFMDELPAEEQAMVPENYIYVVVGYPGVEKDMEVIKGFAEEGVEGEFEGKFTFEPLVVEEGTPLGEIAQRIEDRNVGYNDAIIPALQSDQVLFLVKELAHKHPETEARPGLIFVDPFLSTMQGLMKDLSDEEKLGWRWTFTNIQFFPAVFRADADFASDYIGPFYQQYKETVGMLNPLNALGFSGIHTWAAILDMAGSTKKKDIVEAANQVSLIDIINTNWNGITFGETSFGDKGANIDVIPGTAHLNERGSLEVVELPGGFTPSSAYADVNIQTNYSCLMNCISIGVSADVTVLHSVEENTYDSHATYSWDSHNTSTVNTTTDIKSEVTTEMTGGKLCFLTTACVEARDLPDDCYELQTLREFRDNYVRNLPNGEDTIREYYEIAPRIIKRINGTANPTEIFETMYERLVQKSIKLIESGRKTEAFENYRTIVRELKQEYL